MKIGDVSRQRRFADPARQRWYAYHRAVRFAQRMRQAGSVFDADFITCHFQTNKNLAKLRG